MSRAALLVCALLALQACEEARADSGAGVQGACMKMISSKLLYVAAGTAAQYQFPARVESIEFYASAIAGPGGMNVTSQTDFAATRFDNVIAQIGTASGEVSNPVRVHKSLGPTIWFRAVTVNFSVLINEYSDTP